MTADLVERTGTPQLNLRGVPLPGFPAQPNTGTSVDGKEVLWLGPDEWLVLGAGESQFAELAAVDVSALRAILELKGRRTRDVLACGCSLDLRPAFFPPGNCAQTLLGRVPAILYCIADTTFLILVAHSFKLFTIAWLEDTIKGVSVHPLFSSPLD